MLVEFHQRVAAGASPEAALHAARTAVRANDATRAPWFWAQWMVVGR
jgi:CHAT domain-containing protein